MAMTITLAKDVTHGNPSWSRRVRELRFSISTTGGTASGTSAEIPAVSGYVIGVKAEPSSSSPPANGWGVKLLDRAGFDLLQGSGLLLPNNTSSSYAVQRMPVDTKNSASIFLLNEAVRVDVSGFGSTNASADIVFYLLLP